MAEKLELQILSEFANDINLSYRNLSLTQWQDSSPIPFDCDLLFLDFHFKSSYSGYAASNVADQLENAKQSIKPFLRSDGAVIAFTSEPVYFTRPASGGNSYVYNKDVLEEIGVSIEFGGIREYDCTPVLEKKQLKEYIAIVGKSSCYPTYQNHRFESATELIRRGEQGKVCGVAFENINGTGNGSAILLPRPDKLTVRPEDWFNSSLAVAFPYFPDHIQEKLDRSDSNDSQAQSGQGADPIGDRVRNIFNRFHLVSQQLEYRYQDRETLTINDEHDVQDLLHSLLWLEFDDIRDEENAPSHAGSASRIDFLLKKKSIGPCLDARKQVAEALY